MLNGLFKIQFIKKDYDLLHSIQESTTMTSNGVILVMDFWKA